MLRVLGRASSNNVQKVLWLLEELHLPFSQENYGGTFANTRTAGYLKLNPHATVPTLVDGETVIWESNTILRYLAAKYQSALYPGDLGERARIEQWMDWQIGTLSPAFRPLFIGLVREGLTIGALTEQHAAAARLFQILNDVLTDREHLAAPGMTLADIAIGPMLYRWHMLNLASEETPHLRRWLERLSERPGFRKHVMVALA